MSFNPNEIGLKNGRIFGFPYSEEESEIIIIPIAFDATASFGKGASTGPDAVLEMSSQLDFYSHHTKNAWDTKVFMLPISDDLRAVNADLCDKSVEYFEFLEKGGQLEESPSFKFFVNEVDQAQVHLKENLKQKVLEYQKHNKKVLVLGGEHSVPLGAIEAMSEIYSDFGVLQIDAHADLRDSYEGFKQSHASIMHNVLKVKQVSKLVQVGIRDLCDEENTLIESEPRIKCFFDWQISKSKYEGASWSSIVDSIVESLPENVYISFDIDGLKPELCPNTGTPVPGGLEYNEVLYLFGKIRSSGKKIIGADLCEVSGLQPNGIDANVGARILWEMTLLM